jgi:hypothetical protein
MTGRRFVLAGLVALLAGLLWVPGAQALTPPSPVCNGGGCGSGWYRGSVTVSWNVDPTGLTSGSCGSTTVSNDTTGQNVSCTVSYGSVTVSNVVTIHKDSTPPGVKVSLGRGPDANGWYTQPVPVSFAGDDGTSGVASCTSGTYGGPDGADVTVSGSCTDRAGNVGSGSSHIKYDATPPTASATPDRKPDRNGWYNHPVTVSFSATDVSGVACNPPAVYKGPAADPAKVSGKCQDGAGHTSADAVLALRYDATPPARPRVKISTGSRGPQLRWTLTRDVSVVEVVRAPGPRGRKSGVLMRGRSKLFVDRTAKAGTRYWYEVRVYDQAGNMASRVVKLAGRAAPQRSGPILAPLDGAVLRAPPIAAWKPVKGASFYNLQLWRGHDKLLTVWPTSTRYRLKRTWTFLGREQRLTPGTYTIYIWAAYGTTASPRFGKLLAKVTFTVRA